MKYTKMSYKVVEIVKIIKWTSLVIAILGIITEFLVGFILSYNGVDLNSIKWGLVSISWIAGIIIFFISKKILEKLATYSFYLPETKKEDDSNFNFEQTKASEFFLTKQTEQMAPKVIFYEDKKANKTYERKNLVTNCENYFYNIIEKNFGNDYKVQVQIPLSSVIHKNKNFPQQYQNELYRTIDIGIFAKTTLKPLLLIEINDATHNVPKRRYRDYKVKKICEEAGIKLITFYTYYPNSEQNIVNEIKYRLN